MRFLALTLNLLIASVSYAECSFKTAEYLTSLHIPKSIKSIDIKIPKSSKFARNQFKIISSKSEIIPDKLKKNFKAILTVNYDFGSCKYLGNVRQSGDWKDHINLIDGNLIQSLDVKLEDGNVLGATRFKLLIPETRLGRNEILGTLLLRELGYIAPETFEVNVNVNGLQFLMLFQEKTEKELLERNLRREGPIFEGDESLLWSYQNYSIFELEPLALSRLVNDNWFKKGYTSKIIVIDAFNRLQKSYIDYAYSNLLGENRFYLQANNKDDSLFNDYHKILLAMGGSHALRPHNRKFYFNAIEDRFEPIYYDGNLSFSAFEFAEKQGFEYLINTPSSTHLIERLKMLLISEDISKEFLKRIVAISDDLSFINKSISQVISNLELFETMQNPNSHLNTFGHIKEISWFHRFQKEKNLSQNIVQRVELGENDVNLYLANNIVKTISFSQLPQVISKNKTNGERYVVIQNVDQLDKKSDYKELTVDQNEIRTSDGIEIELEEKNKKIVFTQHNASDWVLFLGGDYSNWDISFKGSTIKQTTSNIGQRFNEFGLTGCLTLYQTTINNAQIKVSDGQCEDSLNLLGVQGSNLRLVIKDAFADALDADFSKLDISHLEIKNAGNDCFDVSGGFYTTRSAMLENCSDKAISIGEMSTFEAVNVYIEGANIGISSKDLSQARVESFNARNLSYCGEAKQKKQEFGGGVLIIEDVDCQASFDIDAMSLIQKGDL